MAGGMPGRMDACVGTSEGFGVLGGSPGARHTRCFVGRKVLEAQLWARPAGRILHPPASLLLGGLWCRFWGRLPVCGRARYGAGVCRDSTWVLGLLLRVLSLPGRDKKLGGGGWEKIIIKIRAKSKIKAADCLPNKNRTQQRAHIGQDHSLPRC